MTQYSDLEDLANSYNLTGNLSGTSSVPNITLSTDINGKNIITYTHFASYADITSAGYYDANDPEAQNIVDGDDYRDDIEDAIETILNPTSAFSVMFSDVAKIDFQEASSSTGIITFAQMEDSFPAFNSSPSTTAGTYMYDGASAYPSDYYGDIFINLDHDARPGIGNTGIGTNVWTVEGDVVAGTDAYTVLMEEISHALGVDIYQPGTATPKNAGLDSNKYTVTSYNVHPDMYFEDDVILGITNGDDIYGPHPTGLQLYDIAALQAIYGREYTTRNAATTYTFGTDEAFGATKDDAFVYTIWDGGGTDEIVATGYDHRVQIDLRQGRFSSIGERGDGTAVALDNGSYDAGNVAIAYYTVIEDAIGTAYDDILIGNAWNNSLIGGSGNDKLYGDGIVYDNNAGFHDDDPNESGDPNESAASDDSGDDYLNGGAGEDELYGGRGIDSLYGGSDNDKLFGGEGSDFLYGDGGNDELTGGAGDDMLYGGNGNDTYYFSASWGQDTIVENWSGTNEIVFDETITASDLNVEISNDDLVYNHVDGSTLTLSNYLLASSSNNINVTYLESSGGSVDQWIYQGTSSHNTYTNTFYSSYSYIMFGKEGNDTLWSTGYNDDVIYGGDDKDSIRSQGGNDTIYGGNGDDFLYMANGYAVENGGSANWVYNVYGDEGNDEIYFFGFTGHAIVSDSAGDDLHRWQNVRQGSSVSITDSQGDDTYLAYNRDANIQDLSGNDYYDLVCITQDSLGGSLVIKDEGGVDHVNLGYTSGWSGFYGYSGFGQSGNDLILYFDSFQRSITFQDYYLSDLYKIETASYNDTDVFDFEYFLDPATYVIGSSAHDASLNGSSSSNVMYGFAGNDNLYGLAGDDTLIGGAGNDLLNGGDGIDNVDYLAAASGIVVDLSMGTASNDGDGNSDTLVSIENVTGSAYADSITGDAGDNVLSGNAGDDTLIGGAGDDTLEGGDGIDTANYANDTNRVYVDLASGNGYQDWDGSTSTYQDTLTLIENAIGGSADDRLFGSIAANTLQGNAGRDYIRGWDGDDVLEGGADEDLIVGDDGDDILRGGEGNDKSIWSGGVKIFDGGLQGGNGNDTIYGEAGDDQAWGHAGNDTIHGGIGNDVLEGSEGDDIINGDNGDDILYGDDQNSTTGFIDAGNDTLSGGAGADYLGGGAGDDLLYGGTDNDQLWGTAGADTIYGDGGNDVIYGDFNGLSTVNDGADTIYGGDGADVINSGGGNDIVHGGADNDVIYARDGNDTINGDDGNDIIYGENGEDIINGGIGADTLNGGDGIDTINGENGDDTLIGEAGADILSGGTGVDYIYGGDDDDIINGGDDVDVLHGQNGSDVISGDDGNDYLYGDFNNLDETTYSYSGNDILDGGAGNDQLFGGKGADTMTGGAGADTFFGGSGNDTMNGGTENDYMWGDSGGTYFSDTGDDVMNGEAGADTLLGQNGNDILLFGEGADLLYGGNGDDIFQAYEVTSQDSDMGFAMDFVEGEDAIDISNLLNGYDPLTDVIGDFVNIAQGSHTTIQVDRDGAGTAHGWDNIIRIQNNTTLSTDETQLINDGTLAV